MLRISPDKEEHFYIQLSCRPAAPDRIVGMTETDLDGTWFITMDND